MEHLVTGMTNINAPPNPFCWGKLIVDPGNLVDTIVILKIKKDKFGEPIHPQLQEALCNAVLLLDLILDGFPDDITDKIQGFQEALHWCNLRQWDLEDQVRNEGTGEAARAARENNSKRVKIKNEINTLFGYPTEYKSYRGEK